MRRAAASCRSKSRCGAPAGTKSMSPEIDGQPLIPAGARSRQSSRPVRAAKAWIQPSNVGTNTTSRETVAHANGAEPSARCHSRRPVVGLEGHEDASALLGRPLQGRRRLHSALGHAQLDDGDEEPSGRERHGSQHPAEETGAHARRPMRQRPDVVEVGPDGARPDAPARRPVPRDDATSLPRPEHPLTAAGAREDRRHVEVVVADVVRDDLVVPEEPARVAVEHHERVGVERAARDTRRRSARLRSRPRARGSRYLRRRGPRRRPIPGSTTPPPPAFGVRPPLRDRVELPAHATRARGRAHRSRHGRRAGIPPC